MARKTASPDLIICDWCDRRTWGDLGAGRAGHSREDHNKITNAPNDAYDDAYADALAPCDVVSQPVSSHVLSNDVQTRIGGKEAGAGVVSSPFECHFPP